MKIAIHNGSGWNKKWIEYSIEKDVPYIIVNCYDTDVVQTLKENKVTHLMWHFNHSLPEDLFMARNVLFSAEKMGIKVFPNFDGSWHFDDKVSQKYLLEAIDAPVVPNYAFYNKKEAILWAENQKYPIVAKLRRGAGSYNVKLIKNFYEAKSYINKMFGNGIHPSPGYVADAKTKLKVAGNIEGVIRRLKKAPNFFKMVMRGRKGFPREKGYVYFQEFIPNNKSDYRIIVIDNVVYGMQRLVRENDFRASGAGVFNYENIDENIIKIAYDVSKKLNMQSVAFDFVIDHRNNNPLIVEISYGFGTEGSSKIDRHWVFNNDKLEIEEGKIDAAFTIIEKFISNDYQTK